MYVLFIANKNYSSWSLRPWVLMETLGIPFEERVMPLGQGPNGHDFRKFAPNGKVPCLHDGATVVWDSLAIVEYLAERHAGVWPSDAGTRAFARSAVAEMHSGYATLRQTCSMSCGLRVRLHRTDAGLRGDLERLQEVWQDGLSRFGGPFLAGSKFGAVDAFFAPVAFRIQTYGLELGRPAMDYAARLLALPAMQRWYEAGLAESWRDDAHDQETLAVGTVLEDLRRTAGAPAD